MENIKEKIISILNKIKEPFVSEADFQFYLTWELQLCYKDSANIILEYPAKKDGKMHYYDIAVKPTNGEIVFIELKYKTKGTEVSRYGETITLKNHGARPQNKYRFIKDIQRMEEALKSRTDNIQNFCILLTNDPNYWEEKGNNTNSKSKYISSSIYDVIKGNKSWIEDSNKIHLDNIYSWDWKTLKNLDLKNLDFRYLLLEVKK